MSKGTFNVNLNNVSTFHLERNPRAPFDRDSVLISLTMHECHSLKNTYPRLGMC